jgi:hypothetical protein
MELLAGAFHKAFRKELYPTVGRMQDKLGVLNDHATAYARLSQWLEETEDPIMAGVYTELASREAAAIQASADEFRNWWTAEWADEFEGQLRELIEQEPV